MESLIPIGTVIGTAVGTAIAAIIGASRYYSRRENANKEASADIPHVGYRYRLRLHPDDLGLLASKLDKIADNQVRAAEGQAEFGRDFMKAWNEMSRDLGILRDRRG